MVGWFGSGGQALHYNPVRPAKILDTRNGTGGVGTLNRRNPRPGGGCRSRRDPHDAQSVVATLTVIRSAVATDATTWTAGDSRPGVADFSLPSGATREGLVSPELSRRWRGGGRGGVRLRGRGPFGARLLPLISARGSGKGCRLAA